MKIGVNIQPLARVLTTGTPYRGMLRELLKLRSDDYFEFYVFRDSTDEPLIQELLGSFERDNWKLVPLDGNRRISNVKALAGLPRYFHIDREIDVLLSSDFDFHDFRLGRQISHLHDLAAIDCPEYCSLPWHGRFIRRQQLRLLADSEVHICTISEFSKRRLLSADHRFAGRVTVVHNGIDPLWHRRPAPLHSQSPFGDNHRYWIWWGQITKRKNVQGILKAYAVLRTQQSSLPNLLFVGKLGRDSSDLPQLIKRLGIFDFVKIIPFQSLPTLIDLVSLSIGAVFPSFYEGFGLPVVEALARGIPVVTSDMTSLPEVAGGNAILVHPDSIESIRAGMAQSLLPEQNHNNTVGIRRRQWASQFTYTRAAQMYSAVIEQELAAKATP